MHRLLVGSALVVLAFGLVPAARAANFTVDQDSLTFSSNAGVSIPPQFLTVTNNDPANGVTISVSGTGVVSSVSPGSLNLTKKGGNNSVGTVTVNVKSGLQVGSYFGSVILSGGGETITVGVEVDIFGVNISVSPNSATVNVQQGKKASTSFVISGGPAAILVGANGPGLSGGSANAPGSFTESVDATNLAPGIYSGTLTFSCAGGGSPCVPQVVSVTVNVTAAVVNITVSPSSVSVSVVAGQQALTPAFVISGGPASVQVSASGTALGGGSATAPGSFAAPVSAVGLTPGNYSGTLTFSCANCVAQVVSVSINVVAPVQLVASRNSVSFQAYQGRPAPAAQSFTLSATGGSTAFNVQNVPSWLQVTPANGNVSSGATVITLTLIPSALALGSNTATFSFIGAGSSTTSVTVSATLVKLSLSVNPTSASATLGPGQTQNIPLTISTADNGMVAVTTSATTTRGGPWIKLATTDFMAPGPVPAITLDATGLTAGSYGGTITYSCAASSQVDCGQTAVPVNLTVTAAAPPSITPGGLVVASSFGQLKTIGPGTYIEIYGQNLANTTTGWGQFFVNNVAPTTVQGVGVKINGESAFVNFVSPGQINALVPGDVSPGPAQVVVSNAQGTSTPFTVTVAPQQPTLLAPASFVISGKQYVAAFLPPDYATTFALPTGAIAGGTSRPVKPGEVLVMYGLGFGAVTPNVLVGTIAPVQTTKLNAPLQILFNQTAGNIVYSGLAAGFVGLYQFNVQVPQVADNDAVPLTFTLSGTAGSQMLYIAVHQ